MAKGEKTPLLKALTRFKKLNSIPFHMPGHKKGQGIMHPFKAMLKRDPFAIDLTELPGLDDLHDPHGPIESAMKRAAILFGAQRTFFLVNGTSVGIHAAIMSVCKPGQEILLPRNVHRAVIGACILSGAFPRYLPLRMEEEFQIPCPLQAREVQQAIIKNPGIKAVFQVYPSYHGLVGDIQAVVKVSHNYNLPLIADEAHGAHFKFSDRLPATALESGADLSVQSTHKTLGALTQASMLHTQGTIIDASEVARQLRILQSTSPSYILMASLDAAVGQLEDTGCGLVDKAVSLSLEIRNEIDKLPGLRYLGDRLSNGTGFLSDPTKIYISACESGLSGFELAEILRNKYNIQVELADIKGVICMLSMGNTERDAEILAVSLREISSQRHGEKSWVKKFDFNIFPVPKVAISPRDAWFSPGKKVCLQDALGELAFEIIAPYPPGVPLLCPGEVISSEVIEAIQYLKAWGVSFHGPEDTSLTTIKVIG